MRVLFIEDEGSYLNDCLAEIEKHYVVDVAYTASDGEYLSEVNDYDMIVVDSALPDKESHDLCRQVREANCASPILVLADRENTDLRIKTLRHGASVCMYKPVHPTELSLQIDALVKLKSRLAASQFITAGPVSVDTISSEASINGQVILLRKKEFGLLEYLAINKGRVVSKEEILEHVWEDGILVRSNTLEVHIRNLRTKLDRAHVPGLIKTIKGFGYKLG
jgi:DNA-binding response OmpR family regulator